MDMLTGCMGSIAAEGLICTAKTAIRHVGYLFRFKKTVVDLTKAKTELKSEQQNVREAIDQAAMNTEVVEKDVETWLADVDKLLAEVEAFENNVKEYLRLSNGWCPDWIRQYKLSKEAIQKTNVVKGLQADRGKFSKLTHRPPTPGIEIFSSSDFKVFESRNLACNQIMEVLKEDNNKGIGLYGMGGIGKTTLVKEVHNKVKELNIFNEIVMITVSRTPDVRRIQGEIADCLHLKLEEESDTFRANRICFRIKKVVKILIIVDDVWGSVKLEEFGIPSPDDHKGCSILLTTRCKPVCGLMFRDPWMISLDFLLKEESLALMKSIVGDNPDLNDVMLKVVEECKGLPIAISTVGKALKGKTLDQWEAAIDELRSSRLVDIEGVKEEKNAYACIKWSYDQLKCKTKLCFLLCSLFPEDYDIPIEELTRHLMVLEKYDDDELLKKRRTQVLAAIHSLKDSSLLLDGFATKYVKMHDMVRDVGLWIASEGKNEFELRACTCLDKNIDFKQVTAISLMASNTQLPDKLVCPRLNILFLGGKGGDKEIPNTLFEGMNCLKVLRIRGKTLSSQSLQFLTNLRTLYLECCDFSDDLSSLGKLKSLETLTFYICGVFALPSEFGEMTSLKMLALMHCNQLKHIPPNVIQRLSKLQELFIDRSFKNWDVEGTTSEISNANLSELNSLPRLVNLSLKLNPNHLPKGFVFPDLHRYFISIHNEHYSHFPELDGCINLRILDIEDLNASSVNALKLLFRTVEYLWIKSCKMECIVDTNGGNHTGNLVRLYLNEMRCLKTICEGPNQNEIFSNLTILAARGCPRLISLFSPSHAQSLKKLELLFLDGCDEMKQIISEEGMILESHGQPICLPKLKTLEVEYCEKLEYIFSISVARGLQQLERLTLRRLPRLKKVFGQNREGDVGDCERESHHQPSGFPKLETLWVLECENLEYIFPISIARELPQLESLRLENLPQLKQVFGLEGGDAGDGNNSVLSKLTDLRLKNLPELDSLGGGNSSSVWPSLERLYMENCPKVKSFFANVEANVPAMQKLQNLQILPVDDRNAISFDLMQGLSKLEELEIKNCGGIQEVIKLEGLPTIKGEQDLLLPRLEKMLLNDLHELRCIWKGVTKLINLNNLEDLRVIRCKKLTHLFTPALAQSLQKLKFLKIKRCDELEHLIVENVEEHVSSESHLQPLCFPKLERVNVGYCNKLKSLFPMTIADSLLELQIFLVKKNPQLMEVFTHEGDAGVQKDVTLPQLGVMGLKGLPSLVNFCPENYQFILPKLWELGVESCKNLRTTFTCTPDRGVLINGEVAQIDEPTGTSTISPVLTIFPANNDIKWKDLKDDPTRKTLYFDWEDEFEWELDYDSEDHKLYYDSEDDELYYDSEDDELA